MLLWLLLLLLVVPGDTPEVPADFMSSGIPQRLSLGSAAARTLPVQESTSFRQAVPREASAPSTGTQLVHESKLLWGTLAVRWELLGRRGVTLCVSGVPLGLLG